MRLIEGPPTPGFTGDADYSQKLGMDVCSSDRCPWFVSLLLACVFMNRFPDRKMPALLGRLLDWARLSHSSLLIFWLTFSEASSFYFQMHIFSTSLSAPEFRVIIAFPTLRRCVSAESSHSRLKIVITGPERWHSE